MKLLHRVINLTSFKTRQTKRARNAPSIPSADSSANLAKKQTIISANSGPLLSPKFSTRKFPTHGQVGYRHQGLKLISDQNFPSKVYLGSVVLLGCCRPQFSRSGISIDHLPGAVHRRGRRQTHKQPTPSGAKCAGDR